jgi:hypothetical protein
MSVPDAIASVLSASGEQSVRMVEIHAAVELLVRGRVPRSTVKTALATRRFVRVGRGRYQRRGW